MKISKKVLVYTLSGLLCLGNALGFPATPFSFDNDTTVVSAAKTIWDGTEDTAWYDSEETEMHISTAEEFAGFIRLVAGGNAMKNQKIILDNDIYLNDLSEMEIDSSKEPSNIWTYSGKDFEGTFDGTNHTIYGLYSCQNPIFHTLCQSSVIENLNIENAIIKADNECLTMSIICTANNGTIRNCYLNADFECNRTNSIDVGMICYKNSGNIISCTSKGNINSNCEKYSRGGGICYSSTGLILECQNTANSTGFNEFAGIACLNGNSGKIEKCINYGDLEAITKVAGITVSCSLKPEIKGCINYGNIKSNICAGGIIADSEQINLNSCGNNGIITAAQTGGLIGLIDGTTWDTELTINYCYNKGNVIGIKSTEANIITGAGGLVGVCDIDIGQKQHDLDILSSYNIGSVSGITAGGCLGTVFSENLFTITLKDFYSSTSKINGTSCGTLIGELQKTKYTIENCYYVNTGAAQAIGNVSKNYGVAKSADNMKKESFVQSLENFVYNPEGYPKLFWEHNASTISIAPTTISFTEFKQQEQIKPDTEYDGTINWTSSDENVATVDENGVVTAIRNGSCIITVQAGSLSTSCDVTVSYDYYLNKTSVKMNPDLNLQLRIFSKNKDNNEQIKSNIEFTSSNPNVAEVDENGLITALSPGKTDIHAVIGEKDLVCTVTVNGENKGDVNGDGAINTSDLIELTNWMLGKKDLIPDKSAGDFNNDGKITIIDFCLMKETLLK